MKINIFFFISDFKFGGASGAIFNFLKKIDKKKFKTNIIFLGNSDYEKSIPKNVNTIKLSNQYLFFNTFQNFFKIRKIIKNKVKNNNKNLFISNIHYSNILSIIFLRDLKNLKIFLFERTSIKELDIYFSLFSLIKNKIIKYLIKLLYPYADGVFANSITGKKELLKNQIKAKTIYSGSIRKILPKKKFKEKKYFKIIAVGRLSKQKNYTTLIDSVSLIKNKNFKLFIYGDGLLKDKIKEQIIRLNLVKNIRLMSHIKNKDKIYKNSDLLVHTSLFEGLPNCIVEAINYGVPTIAYDGQGGISEILGNGKYGNLVRKNSKYEISKKIENFLNNPKKLQNKIISAKSILKKFSYVKTTSSLEKEILKVF